MTIRIKIKELCERTGMTYNGHEVNNARRLKLAANLSSPDTANKLWKDEMNKIGLETIEVLCRTLGCTPNDLFAFDPPLAQNTPAVKFTRAEVDQSGRLTASQPLTPGKKRTKKSVKKISKKLAE